MHTHTLSIDMSDTKDPSRTYQLLIHRLQALNVSQFKNTAAFMTKISGAKRRLPDDFDQVVRKSLPPISTPFVLRTVCAQRHFKYANTNSSLISPLLLVLLNLRCRLLRQAHRLHHIATIPLQVRTMHRFVFYLYSVSVFTTQYQSAANSSNSFILPDKAMDLNDTGYSDEEDVNDTDMVDDQN